MSALPDFSGPVTLDVVGLKNLTLQHVQTVPFENLGLHLQAAKNQFSEISVDLQVFWRMQKDTIRTNLSISAFGCIAYKTKWFVMQNYTQLLQPSLKSIMWTFIFWRIKPGIQALSSLLIEIRRADLFGYHYGSYLPLSEPDYIPYTTPHHCQVFQSL